MLKYIGMLLIFITITFSMFSISINSVEAKRREPLILSESTKKKDLYPAIDIIKDREMQLTIDDVVSGDFSNAFVPIHAIKQKKGFFETPNWLRFEVKNQSDQDDWFLEFAFALI